MKLVIQSHGLAKGSVLTIPPQGFFRLESLLVFAIYLLCGVTRNVESAVSLGLSEFRFSST